jgi:putative ABC transport system permease protein
MVGNGVPVETWWQDMRFTVKAFSKTPGFTAVALATLALGIGVTTATFSLVNSVLLNPFPFEDANRLVEVWAEGEPMGAMMATSPQPEMLRAWLEGTESFEAIGLYNEKELTHSSGDGPEILNGAVISTNLLGLLRVGPRLGRAFVREDIEQNDGKVVLLSESFWQQRFGSDPGALGQALTLDGESHTIVGIVPLELERLFEARFFIGPPKQVWRPLSVESIQTWEDTPFVIARLQPSITVQQAQAELDVVQSRLSAEGLNEDGWSPLVVSTSDMVNVRLANVLWVLFAAVCLVLLIGCSNIANMLMARGMAREHEFAIRSALGASRARVTRQLLVEGLFLSLTGAALGFLLSKWMLDTVVGVAAAELQELRSVRIDPIVLVFTVSLSLLAATVFALAPVAQLKISGVANALRGGKRTASPRASRAILRQGLVVAEVAMALVLFLGAGLLLNSFFHLSKVDPGFDPNDLVAVEVTLPEARYPDEVQRAEFFEAVVARVKQLPTAKDVALARSVPPDVNWLFGTVEIIGRDDITDTQPLKAGNWISDNYLQAMGAALREGRTFTVADRGNESRSVIVNEALADHFWPDGGVLGSRFRLDLPFQTDVVGEHQVVGVVRTVKAFGLGDDADRMQIYFPFETYGKEYGRIVARASGDPNDLMPQIKEQVWGVDPNLPITSVIRMEHALSSNIARPRFNAFLLSSFAALALFLALIGVYGVTAFAANQRTREIGVRVALGAKQSDVLRLMVGTGLKPIAIGIVIGLGASFALTRFLRSLLFEIEPTDPATFALATTLLALVGIAACYLPSRRATRVDPVEVLRQE